MIGIDLQCLPFWISSIFRLRIPDLMTKVNSFDDVNKNTHFLLNQLLMLLKTIHTLHIWTSMTRVAVG